MLYIHIFADQLENVDCAELNGDEIIPENDDFIVIFNQLLIIYC